MATIDIGAIEANVREAKRVVEELRAFAVSARNYYSASGYVTQAEKAMEIIGRADAFLLLIEDYQ